MSRASHSAASSATSASPAGELGGPVISSPQSKRLKEIVQLAKRATRTKTGRFVVEGPQGVREAVQHQLATRPASVTSTQNSSPGSPQNDSSQSDSLAAPQRSRGAVLVVFATAEAAARHPEIVTVARSAGVRVREVTPDALAAVADTQACQGLVAICEFLDHELADVITNDAKLVVVLNQVRDPGNAGTIIRVADAAGADAVIVTNKSVDVYNDKTVRSTAGSLFHVPVITHVGLAEVAELARARGLQVLAADTHPPVHDLHEPWLTGLDLAQPTAWVFGNEAWGLPSEARDLCDGAVRVPLYGRAESLNLATAAAICVFESARNRT